MVVGLTEGFLSFGILGNMFPVPGAWSTLIGVLVGIRVLLFALGAKPDHHNPLKEIGSIVLYFFILFYFGPYVLVVILALHFLKKMEYLKLSFLDKILPDEESSPKDVSYFIFASLFSWIYGTGALGSLSWLPIKINGVSILNNVFGWVLVLLLMVIFVRPKAQVSMRRAMISTFVIFAVVLAAFGPTALYLLLIFLMIKPFISKFKVAEKVAQAPGIIRERAETRAREKAEEKGEGAKEAATQAATTAAVAAMTKGKGGAAAGAAAGKGEGAFTGVEGYKALRAKGVPASAALKQSGVTAAQVLAAGKGAPGKGAPAKTAEEERIEGKIAETEKLEEAEIGAIEKLNAKEIAQLEARIDELEGQKAELKADVPSNWKFIMAFVAAIISDIIDLIGIGEIPVVSDIIDGITLIFVVPVVMPAIQGIMKGKGMGNIAGLLMPALEFVGEGPLVFLDIFPFWTLGIGALWMTSHFGPAGKKMKKIDKEIKKLKSATGGEKKGFKMPGYIVKLAAGMLVLIIVLIFVLPQLNFIPSISNSVGNAMRYVQSGEANADAQRWAMNMRDWFTNLLSAPGKWWGKQIAIATGDYYTGQVDANTKRNLGVFLENLKTSEKIFRKDKKATVWGTLKGEALDIDKCYETPNDKTCFVDVACVIPGAPSPVVSPQKVSFLDLVSSGQLISCDFTPKQTGSLRAHMFASFNFETKSYIPVYFVDRNLKIDYAKQGKDLLKESGITQTKPVATYTPGPVGIGIQTFESMPLAVALSPATPPAAPTTAPTTAGAVTGYAIGDPEGTGFGITLENLWQQGKLIGVKNMTIIIPVSLKLEKCSPAEFIQTGEGAGERNYSIDPTYADQQLDITDFWSMNCRLVAAGPPQNILGPTPVTTHFIKVTAIYRYQLEKTLDVTVLEAEART